MSESPTLVYLPEKLQIKCRNIENWDSFRTYWLLPTKNYLNENTEYHHNNGDEDTKCEVWLFLCLFNNILHNLFFFLKWKFSGHIHDGIQNNLKRKGKIWLTNILSLCWLKKGMSAIWYKRSNTFFCMIKLKSSDH